MWEGISLARPGTWGDQLGKIRERAEQVGTRARQARLSGDGMHGANWYFLV